ncbi:MAG: hypothetical protein IJC52_04730 [Clostridia bacterium]|nr:hypothetical protein [Clostridia bacterium]
MNYDAKNKSVRLTVFHIVMFGLLGAMMFAGDVLMEWLPNVHFVGILIVAATVVYRAKALFPLYIYVFLSGLFGGFSTWWIPYLYVWTVLWGMAMLIPQRLPNKAAPFVYAAVCGLHGLLFGTLCAPAQMLLFGLNVEGTLAWIAAGLPFDLIHAAGNAVGGLVLIAPMVTALTSAEKFAHTS